MFEWFFSVADHNDVDVNRILQEAAVAKLDAVLITGGAGLVMLALHNSLLDQFHIRDNVVVGEWYLCPTWGRDKIAVDGVRGRDLVFSSFGGGKYHKVLDWRVCEIRAVDVAMIKRQIAAARDFKRRYTVKVHSL